MIEKIKEFCLKCKLPSEAEVVAKLGFGIGANRWAGFCEGQMDMAKRILELIAENEQDQVEAT